MSKGRRKLIGFLVAVIFLFTGALLIKNAQVYEAYKDGIVYLYFGLAVANSVEHIKEMFGTLRGKK
ncbi:hypothetical protein DRQ17_00560 [bacterium]|nr:MAG: hypothetical protein DRQ17_00560 [bacterium]